MTKFTRYLIPQLLALLHLPRTSRTSPSLINTTPLYPTPHKPSFVQMSLTTAFAHASAAAAAGQGKKAAQVQLQAELNTDDEWNKFLHRDGLLVVDVYTGWCGPCLGMVGNLKKIKVEIGGDNLHLAVAKSDTIECLKRFRNRSEPTWMFLAAGQLLNVIFGADAPRIARTIEQELKNEELARKGELQRPVRAPHELTPPEQEVADAKEKEHQERRERETSAAEAARTARREARARLLEAHFKDLCPALVTPHAQKNLRKITDALEPHGVIVADKCPILLGKEVKVLAMEEPALGSAAAAAALADRPALALLFKKPPEREGDVIELCRRALYNEGLEECPKKPVVEELVLDGVPGLMVPADRHQRAAVLDILFPKMVSGVAPPPASAEPPHVAAVLGAWQRRAALAAVPPKQLIRYGFYADQDLENPRLLCKTIDQYEQRAEKDYSETIILMIAVGLAEPALADPTEEVPTGPPAALFALGPLHISADSVVGAAECARAFPPGYSVPEHKPKPKAKKKKKKRHETKEEILEENPETITCSIEAENENEPGTEAEDAEEPEGEADEEEEEPTALDKATSPPPQT